MTHFISLLAYKIVLEISYFFFVSPRWAGVGLVWRPQFYCFLISYGLFIGLAVLLPKGNSRPSHQLAQIFFVVTIIPILSLYWQAGLAREYAIFVSICAGLIFAFLRFVRLPPVALLNFRLAVRVVDIVLVAVCSSILYFFAVGLRVDPRTLNFNTIYDLRAEIALSGFAGYMFNWANFLLIPFCTVSYMRQRRWFLFFSSIAAQLLIYTMTGHKTTLFSLGIIIAFSYLSSQVNWKIAVPNVHAALIMTSLLALFLTHSVWPLAIVPVRLLHIPALISFQHYDFFSQNPRLHFSESMVGRVFGVQSPYAMKSTFLIAALNGSPGSQSNTGFLGDAYANGGFLIMLLFSTIYSVLLSAVDAISVRSSSRSLYTALSVYIVYGLNDRALLTSLLSSGFVMLLFLMYLVASEEATRYGGSKI